MDKDLLTDEEAFYGHLEIYQLYKAMADVKHVARVVELDGSSSIRFYTNVSNQTFTFKPTGNGYVLDVQTPLH